MGYLNQQSKDYSSLQGRLNSISKLEGNQIPVKRTSDGALIDSHINGVYRFEIPNEENILDQSLYYGFNGDDAWIKTEIDTNNGSNSIAIHHDFHALNNRKEELDLQAKDRFRNLNTDGSWSNEVRDNLYIPRPKEDEAGHIVGWYNDRYTLPFGYKFSRIYNTTARIDDKYLWRDFEYLTRATGTHSYFNYHPINKWIVLTSLPAVAAEFGDYDPGLCIGHKLITIEKNNTEVDLNDGYQDSFYIDYLTPDEAGHISRKDTVTYKLPNSYNGIRLYQNYNDTEYQAVRAGKVYELLGFEPNNSWINL